MHSVACSEARDGKGARPTSLDLYRELKAVTPESSQWLLHDLFEKNTFWDLEHMSAAAEQTASGKWQVTLDVEASKVVIDEAGVETVLAMDDWVEIGVYGEATAALHSKAPHPIGEADDYCDLPTKPARAGIDPRLLLVDWQYRTTSRR